jgi:anti-repressor protein
MDPSIQQFESEEFGTIRTTTIDGEPWFVAKDVCTALGIATNHLNESGRGLDEDEIMNLPNWENGGRAPLIISEAGLYSLILKSRKPEAKAFKRWVTHEVLPSIRKHGAYLTPQTMAEMMADPRNIAKVFNALADEQQKVRDLTEDNARMLPKAVAYDAIIDTDGTTTITKVARYLAQIDPRMTVKRLYALLRADELICKADRTPTKLAIKRGIAKQIMSTRNDGKANEPYARLTQKGIDFCVSHYVTIPAQMKTI